MGLRTGALPRPDLSGRERACEVEASLRASPRALYRAFTEQFDEWFAQPGSLTMNPQPDAPFFFETEFDGQRHPHYGRFLALEEDRLVEMTWVTSNQGTHGDETVVRVEIEPSAPGSHVRLVHSGFSEPADADRHHDAWPRVLRHLDDTLAT